MDNNSNFQKLTPINNAELSIYKDALDFVFSNPDVKNVGISGSYSAGKSSVIETYKLDSDATFMHISLAYFQSVSESDRKPIDQNENVLEGKILNQLIHQIDPCKIPQTNFRVKRELCPKKLWQLASMVSLAILLPIYLFNFREWNTFVTTLTPIFLRTVLSVTTMPLSAFLAGCACSGIFLYLIYAIITVQYNKNLFKGISVQGNTIEIFEQSDESYFDKYLNEVVYLFEKSGKDVIVFEDIDRYNTNQIFQRLREINTLVNSRKKDTDKPLRFFYLLRDDIFINKERTKFFDFIMPVVPILDGSNSFDKFIEQFKEGNIYHLFNKHFLQEISLYIDDMRILKNIYNEFLVYYKRISTTEQDPNKLLAIIIYKNVFPRDFSELQLNCGFVYTLFDKKEKFIEDEITKLRSEIVDLHKTIEAAEKEHLQSNEEVDTIYNPKIDNLQRYYHRRDEVQALTNERDSRKENIENKTIERQNEFKKKISLIETRIAELQHKKLHEIINKENENQIFKISFTNEIGKENNFNDIKENIYFPLIKYLIKNGYIDETYPDYITYFYENSLSRVDKIFLRSVTDEQPKDFNYRLKDPALVLGRLSEISFEKEEILNFDLLSYLLCNQTGVNKSKTLIILQQIKVNKNLKFINLYFESGKPIAPFIKILNNIWPSAFDIILTESNYTEERKKQYALESLYHTTHEDLQKVDLEGMLSNFVSSHKDFLNIAEPDIQRLIDAFMSLNIQFVDIDYDCSNKELFQVVYKHNFYIISYELVCLILKNVYGYHEESDLRHKNYSLVLSKAEEPLVSYVHKNIDVYVKEVLAHCKEEILDSEEIVVTLLNNQILQKQLKFDYIDTLKTTICNLHDIKEPNLWTKLIECNLITYSESNVLEYFCNSGNGLDKTLATFINEKATSFDFDYNKIENEFEEGYGSKFFNAVVKSEELGLRSYAGILKSLHRHYKSFNIEGISDSKVEILIDQGVITMTSEVLLFMREYYPQKIVNFIKRNIQKYTEEVISEENFSFNEMCEILETDVDDRFKLSLLQFTDKPISAMTDTYSDEVKAFILKNNFESKDISKLLKKYPSLTKALQTMVEDIGRKYIDEIIEDEYYVPVQMCEKLFELDSLNDENKLKLFSIAVTYFNEAECKECLAILKQDGLLGVFIGKRPAISINATNKKILDIFVEKNWILRYGVDRNNDEMYRISSKRVLK